MCVWFGGISIIVGYLLPNPVYTYILNMICKHFVNNQLLLTLILFNINHLLAQWSGYKY